MKTKQEQIEEIIKILLEASKKCLDADCDCCDKQYEKDCAQYRKAVALVQAGYGDVSEYKAEIERLKDEIIYLERKIAIRDNALKDSDKAIEMLEGKQDTIVKQAQIDVLNKLKKKTHNYYPSIDSYCVSQHIVLVRDIDELIKEVENEQIYKANEAYRFC